MSWSCRHKRTYCVCQVATTWAPIFTKTILAPRPGQFDNMFAVQTIANATKQLSSSANICSNWEIVIFSWPCGSIFRKTSSRRILNLQVAWLSRTEKAKISTIPTLKCVLAQTREKMFVLVIHWNPATKPNKWTPHKQNKQIKTRGLQNWVLICQQREPMCNPDLVQHIFKCPSSFGFRWVSGDHVPPPWWHYDRRPYTAKSHWHQQPKQKTNIFWCLPSQTPTTKTFRKGNEPVKKKIISNQNQFKTNQHVPKKLLPKCSCHDI